MRKYAFTGEELNYGERILYRIVALVDLPNGVREGDLGGWLEGGDSLSQEGDCWVGQEAKVYSGAKVKDNAGVWGTSEVRGRVRVEQDALILGNVLVDALDVVLNVSGSAVLAENAVVTGRVNILRNARIQGNARVVGPTRAVEEPNKHKFLLVNENAQVLENAVLSGTVSLYADALVMGSAVVQDQARVSGSATITGNALVGQDAHVYGNARVQDNAQVYGNALVRGNAVIAGDIHICGDDRV